MGGEFSGGIQNAAKGIYALATADVFKLIKMPEHKAKNLCVCISYFEIYGGKVRIIKKNGY
jgi:kinesin family protein 2/24